MLSTTPPTLYKLLFNLVIRNFEFKPPLHALRFVLFSPCDP